MDVVDDAKITLDDGRTLAYAVYGERRGRPVHVFHGFPGSRLQPAFLHEKAAAAGVCLIAADRPGFGRSSPSPRCTLLSWASDVRALADHLGHGHFDVIGISCGGAYALACAHELPARIGAVALMAGMGPMDVPEIRTRQARILRLMFALARIQPWLVSPLLALDRLLYRGNPKRAVQALASIMTPPDRRFLQENAQVAEAFVSSLAEAYRQGVRGPMLEAALIARARGFDLGRILAPVDVFQGGHDGNVPPEMGRYLARSLQQAELHFRPDEGHLSIVWTCFDECLRRLVTR